MHDNQLISAFEYLKTAKSQLIVSVLQDKLPSQLNNRKYFSLELSQQDKLFRTEKQNIELIYASQNITLDCFALDCVE